jgi:y4mF family transcriptional regulator
MHAKTVRELGAFVRSQRREQGLTQAELAGLLGVSRDWVVRLEQGHPRLEAQRVLDALVVLGVTLDLGASGNSGRTSSSKAGKAPQIPRIKAAKGRKAAFGKQTKKTLSTTPQGTNSARPDSARSENQRSATKQELSAEGQRDDPFAYLTKGR